jgi:hypothetical protein
MWLASYRESRENPMKNFGRTTALASALLLAVSFAPATADGGHDQEPAVVVDGLDGPRGVDTLGNGRTLITEGDGSFSLVIERKGQDSRVIELDSVPPGFIAPAIAKGRHGRIYILTPGGEETGAATLYEWRHGYDAPQPVFNVAEYQEGDPDPFDLAPPPPEPDEEGPPTASNPFGLAALRDGSVLIADAEGNDLIRWFPNGDAVTVARIKPRVVDEIPSEAVATSVTVGSDGYWYVGELRGFPATPDTSQIWRIKPGTVDAVCDPEKPRKARCKRYADGLTSIMDLGARRHALYAVELSKQGWLAAESGEPGTEIGALMKITGRNKKVRIKEIAELVLPGGVDAKDDIYVTGPVFGPGALSKFD